MSTLTPELGRPSACPRPTPYTGKVRTYAQVLDHFITQIDGLNRHQKDALYRLRLEVGAKAQDFDASPHQLAKLWKCSLPTARAYIKAFVGKGFARQLTAHNQGARKAAIFSFDLTAFPQFGDVIKKPTKTAQKPPQALKPEKEIVPSLEREEPSLRSGSFSSRENYSSRKAPEAGAAAAKAEKKVSGEVSVAEAVLRQGAEIIQRVVGLEPNWARKAMAHAAGAFKSWEDLEKYATAVHLVMQKVQAKGLLRSEDLPRMAFKALVRAKDSRRRQKILREASQVPGFLARLKARQEAQAQMMEGSLLAGTQSVDVGGMRVKISGAVPALAIQPYFAWVKAQAAVPDVTDPGYLSRFDEEREAFQALLKVLEGELSEPQRSEMTIELGDRLRGAGVAEGAPVWNRAWKWHWAKAVLKAFGLDEAREGA